MEIIRTFYKETISDNAPISIEKYDYSDKDATVKIFGDPEIVESLYKILKRATLPKKNND